MSKMPAKKKSCFQITSVTTAQVASSITEDTESLDDPDESRTEDVSSEIFDVSRATDYGPEDVCERSSSEETLNNVGEAETPGNISPNLLLDGQLAVAAGGVAAAPPAVAPSGGAVPKSSAAPLSATAPGTAVAASSSAPTALPSTGLSASAALGTMSQTVAAACSSRFRVIKLDHGTGEPYRRGRWTCMEYYDRDSDGGGVLGRTGDCIRHSSTFEQAAQERDSGLGATGGSVVVSAVPVSAHGPDSVADSSLTAVSQLIQTEKMNQSSLQQPNFVIGQQQQLQQPIGGAVPQSTAQPMFSGASVANQQMVVPQQSQPQVNTQGVTQAGPNGKGMAPPKVTVGQPSIPVAQQQVQQANIPVTQPQQFAYSQSQIPPVHLLPTQPSGQTEYMQHMTIMQSQGTIQQATTGSVPSTVASNLPVGQVTGQNPSPVGAPVMGVSAQPGEAVGQGSGLMQSGQTQASQTAVPKAGGVVQQGIGHAGIVQQKSVTQHQMGGSSQVSGMPGAPHAVVSGVQSVPAVVPGTSVPSVSTTTSVTMPNVPVTLVQSQLTSHTSVSRSTGVQPQHVGHSLMQGTPNVPANLPQSNLGQFQTQAQSLVGQIDDTRRKSEPLPQPPLSLIAENKPLVKPPIPDTLANPLQLPASTPMNSLASSVFGISIPVDGDEDRNPSAAFYQAFHFNKLRESKTFWDSGSGASVVAIDNKIEQAMDLVKSHLMYAVREEVEVLKEQIKELVERNSLLERENALLKSLSNNEQLSQLSTQQANSSSTSQAQTVIAQPPQPTQPPQQPNVSSA
ncbi:TSC22 domain family protein 2 isoform X1 [Falco biarmicus]|uniref:TSC22 domain family protein 2 isoform X1 n=1 Tax=Falco cherrug TaxID=345164 RepID=UPI001886771E|nr:TSC22 domain family protein 2 isoform X1 [Falco cherrug]XP_037262484.1 TSC22 domain family protein 2 isoform X1 [Falco rusticolus]XP_056214372.1 TSC22 domain family protein 2 isoform X1 [Falco biarmicus]